MTKQRWWALLVLLLAACFLSPLAALSQHSGGSFGSSRWGSGSSSSRPSSSGSSWSRPSYSRPSYSTGGGTSYGGTSYGGTSYGGTSYGSSSGGGLGALCCIALVILVIVIVVAVMQKKAGGGRAMAAYPPMGGPMPFPPSGGTDTFAVAKLSIAFDSRARAQIQASIAQIAERSNLSGNGLGAAALETAQMLSQHLDAAYMTDPVLSEGISMQMAQQYFETAVSTERGRFIVETVRNDAGGVRKINAPASTARAEEGGGFVVVTIITARRGGYYGFRTPNDRATLAHDLQTILQGDANLNAMEVIWQPSDPNDVMSSAEMAQVFQSLKPLSPDARVPRRACAYCKTVFAAELPTCPNCGAPANS